MGYIYLITNTVNGKRYVGQTLCNDIETRWKQHRYIKRGCPLLQKAFLKYGIEQFKFQIICICFDEDCNYYEPEYIKKYNCLSPNGYNLMTGGANSKHVPETKFKISEANKQRKHIPLSEETKQKISNAKKGTYNYNYGKHIPEEQKQKTRETWKKKKENGILHLTEEMIHNLEKGRQIGVDSMIAKRKPVGKFSKTGEFIKGYTHAGSAAEDCNVFSTDIYKVCKGKRKTAAGFIWKFLPKETLPT